MELIDEGGNPPKDEVTSRLHPGIGDEGGVQDTVECAASYCLQQRK